MLASGAPQTFFMDQLLNDVLDMGSLFLMKDITRLALAVFAICFFFHLVTGAAELSEAPGSCRFFKPRWWLRIAFCLALLMGYRPLFEGFARTSLPAFMTSFGGSWLEIWNGELDAKDQLLKLHHENQDVKQAEVTTTRQGAEDQAWWSKAMAWTVDALITALGIVLSTLAGMFITVLILIQGFWVLGVNVVILGLGPLCIAFLAHEATEGIFWAWAKAWLIYGLLYLPMLGLGARLAGVVFKGITTMVAGSSVVFGDGSDIAMHFIFALLGPLCSLAVFQAIPSLLSNLLASAVGGGSWAAAPAAAAATATAGLAHPVMKGSLVPGGPSPLPGGAKGGQGRTALNEALGVKPGERS